MQDPSPINRPSADEALKLFHHHTQHIARASLLMPVAEVEAPLDIGEMDVFTRGIVVVITYFWGWIDYLRLLMKVLWRGQELRLGSI